MLIHWGDLIVQCTPMHSEYIIILIYNYFTSKDSLYIQSLFQESLVKFSNGTSCHVEHSSKLYEFLSKAFKAISARIPNMSK